MRETDWAWVSACMGVVEGDVCPVEAYINSGGDPTRNIIYKDSINIIQLVSNKLVLNGNIKAF